MEEMTYNGRSEMPSYEYGMDHKLDSSPGDPGLSKRRTVYSPDALIPDRLEMARVRTGYYLKSDELVKLMYPDLYIITQYLEKKPKEQKQTEQTSPTPRVTSPVTCCTPWSRENGKDTQEQGSTYAVNEDNSWSTISLTSSPEDNSLKIEEPSVSVVADQSPEQEPNVMYTTPNSPIKSMIDDAWFKDLDSVFPLDTIDDE